VEMPRVVLQDESLRDGLQFESRVLILEEKLSLFRLLVAAGFQRIQVGSFVHPEVVPQMADTEAFIARVKETPGVLITGLVLNRKGLERALVSGLGHIGLSVSVSDTHSRKNVRRPAAEALADMLDLIKRAADAGLGVRAGTQCSFGCVYEGTVPEAKVIDTLAAMAEAGAGELNLADTTGMANPLQVGRLVKKVRDTLPDVSVSLHLHDTRGLGLVNVMAGYEAGVTLFDVAAGGLGGCPFVKGAAGNVAAEDVVHLFDQIGAETGIDLPKLCIAVEAYERLLGRALPGRMCRVFRILGEAWR
jgi:hydroxymethylglutaryl-CoA lyase